MAERGLKALARRKAELLARSARERAECAVHFQRVSRVLAWAEIAARILWSARGGLGLMSGVVGVWLMGKKKPKQGSGKFKKWIGAIIFLFRAGMFLKSAFSNQILGSKIKI